MTFRGAFRAGIVLLGLVLMLGLVSASGADFPLNSLDIAGQGTDAEVDAGEQRNVTVNVTNNATSSQKTNVTLLINSGQDGVRQRTTDLLSVNSSTIVEFVNVTGDLFADSYIIGVNTTVSRGEENDGFVSGELSVVNPDEYIRYIDEHGGTDEVEAGQEKDIVVYVENQGDAAQRIGVSMEVIDDHGSGVVVESVSGSTERLEVGRRGEVRFENVTGGLSTGNYEIKANTSDDRQTDHLEVQPQPEEGLSSLDIAGQGTDAEVDAGEQRNATVNVTNNANISQRINVSLIVEPAGGTKSMKSIFEKRTGVLSVNGSTIVEFVNVTGDLFAEPYGIIANTSTDAVSGELSVVNPDEEITVLDIADSGGFAEVERGQEKDIVVDVENQGDAAQRIGVSMEVIDDDGDGVVVESVSGSTERLEVGQVGEIRFEEVIGGLSTGNYDITVNTSDAWETGFLDVVAQPEEGLSSLDIAGNGDFTEIDAGTERDVTVNVTNNGNSAASIDVSLIFDSDAGRTVFTNTTAELQVNESQVLAFTDVTGDLDLGGYQVEVNTSDDIVTGGLDVSTPPDEELSALDIAGQGGSASVESDETVDIGVNVTNNADETRDIDMSLFLSSEVQDVSLDKTVAGVAPGETRRIAFENVTKGVLAGNYTVEIQTLYDRVNGNLRIAALEKLSGLDIAGQGGDAAILKGEKENVSVNVTNKADASRVISINLTIEGLDDVVEEQVSTQELGVNQSQIVTFTGVTEPLGTGDKTVRVRSSDSIARGALTVSPAEALSNAAVTGDFQPSAPTYADFNIRGNQNVSVTATNNDEDPRNITVMLTITAPEQEDEEEGPVATYNEHTGLLNPGDSDVVEFPQVTGNLIADTTYSFLLQSSDDAIEPTVRVLPNQILSDLDIASSGDFAEIFVGEQQDITVNVTNKGEQSQSIPVTLEIEDVFQESRSTSELQVNSSEIVTFSNVTGNLASSFYDVNVKTEDASISGYLDVTPKEEIQESNFDDYIPEGQQQDFMVAITNNAEDSRSIDVSLQITAEGEGGEPLVNMTQSSGEVPPSSDIELIFSDVTGDLPAGDYNVVFKTADHEVERSLTVASEEEEPPEDPEDPEDPGGGDRTRFEDQSIDGGTVELSNVQSDGAPAAIIIGYPITFEQQEIVGIKTTKTGWSGENVTVQIKKEVIPDRLRAFTVPLKDLSQQYETGDLLSNQVRERALFAGEAFILSENPSPAQTDLVYLGIAGQGKDATLTQGEDAEGLVAVKNEGGKPGRLNVTLELDGTGGKRMTEGVVYPGKVSQVEFVVPTNLMVGEHDLTVSAGNRTIEGTMTIKAPPEEKITNIRVNGTRGEGSRFVLGHGMNKSVIVNVTNEAETARPINMSVDILANGESVVSRNDSISNLGPGESGRVTFTSVTADLDVGRHSIRVTTGDDTKTATLDIRGPSVTFLGGQLRNGNFTFRQNSRVDSSGIPTALIMTYEENGKDVVAGVAVDEAGEWRRWAEVNVSIVRDGVPGPHTAYIVPLNNVSQEYVPGDVLSDTTRESATDSGTAGINTFIFEDQKTVNGQVEIQNADSHGVNATLMLLTVTPGSRLPYISGLQTGVFDGEDITMDVAASRLPGPTYLYVLRSSTVEREYVVGQPLIDELQNAFIMDVRNAVLRRQISGKPVLGGVNIHGAQENSIIMEGQNAPISVPVTNQGGQSSFDAVLKIDGATVAQKQVSRIPSGATERVTFSGVTDDLAPGKHTLMMNVGPRNISRSLTVAAVSSGGSSSSSTFNDITVEPGQDLVQARIDGAEPNRTISIGFNTTEQTGGEIGVQRIDVGLRDAGDYTVNLSAAPTPPEDVPALEENDTGATPLNYLRIENNFGAENTENATISFQVNDTNLPTGAPDNVVLYRYTRGEWSPLPTRHISTQSDIHSFQAFTPGFSTFAVTEKQPALTVMGAATNTTTATVGEWVKTTVTVSNTGGVAGNMTVNATVGGSLQQTDVRVEAGSTETVAFVHQITRPGNTTVSVNGEPSGSIAVQSTNPVDTGLLFTLAVGIILLIVGYVVREPLQQSLGTARLGR